jgi:vacuolar-type H+-ATPase subunit E/Vma4
MGEAKAEKQRIFATAEKRESKANRQLFAKIEKSKKASFSRLCSSAKVPKAPLNR